LAIPFSMNFSTTFYKYSSTIIEYFEKIINLISQFTHDFIRIML